MVIALVRTDMSNKSTPIPQLISEIRKMSAKYMTDAKSVQSPPYAPDIPGN